MVSGRNFFFPPHDTPITFITENSIYYIRYPRAREKNIFTLDLKLEIYYNTNGGKYEKLYDRRFFARFPLRRYPL